jgi:hypothetical protein
MLALHVARRLDFWGLACALALQGAAPRGAAAQGRPVRVGVEHRSRLERLETDFRASPSDALSALALRTLLDVEVGPPGAHFALELSDSRVYARDGAPLNSTQVDAFDLLAAHVRLSRAGVLAPDDAVTLRMGRLTLDRGSRRLVARNVFRNTINSFTGLDLAWTTSTRAVRLFAVLPVTRRPTDAAALAENEIARDEENVDALLAGFQLETPLGRTGTQLETYIVGLQERDGGVASLDRRLLTPGARVVRVPSPGRMDFQLEAMLQLGTSRRSTAVSDTDDLSHRSLSGHASLGYRFQGRWTPRVVVQYDYAGGDRDPSDDSNNRFDPLCGARAFELNPTGFYGAFARSNISSPALRVEVAPHERFDWMAAYRLVWLASARDAWTTTALVDATGGSGSFLGQQLELRLRSRLVPDRISLDVGGTVLGRGGFARNAPGGRSEAAVYFYAQITFAEAWE